MGMGGNGGGTTAIGAYSPCANPAFQSPRRSHVGSSSGAASRIPFHMFCRMNEQPAFRLGLRGLVLKDVPMFGETAILDPYDVGRDKGRRASDCPRNARGRSRNHLRP